MAAAVNCVFSPMNMVVGGVTGIGITVNHVFEVYGWKTVPLGVFNIVANVPLLLWAWRRLGKGFVGRTLIGTVLLSLFLILIPEKSILQEEDYLLATVVGGTLSGIGIGCVFRGGGSTGGSDLLSLLLAGGKSSRATAILLWIDGIIVAGGCAVFGTNATLYAVFAVILISKLSDGVLTGFRNAKAVTIISEKHESIAKDILMQMERGVTGWNTQGMYTKKEGKTLLCVVSGREVTRLMDIIREKDSAAFVLIQDASKVLGSGFIENEQ